MNGDKAASPVFKPQPLTRVGAGPKWWWSGSRREAWRLRLDCQLRERALVELHLFIAEELDPEPAPWPAYYPYGSLTSQKLAELLQRQQAIALRVLATATTDGSS